MSKILFHKNAIEHFDKKANQIFSAFGSINVSTRNEGFQPNFVPSAIISEQQITGSPMVKIGNQIIYFLHSGKAVGLANNPYQDFLKLVNSIYRNPACSDKVSEATVEKLSFEWLKSKYIKKIDSSLTDFLVREFDKIVFNQKVYVPIGFTAIEREFSIGKVRLRPLTDDLLNEWKCAFPLKNIEHKKNLDAMFEMKRQKLLGYAVGVVELEAEPSYASQIAVTEVDRAIGFLRVFLETNLDVSLVSYSRPKGMASAQTTETIVVSDDNIHMLESSVRPQSHTMILSAQLIDQLQDSGLKAVSNTLTLKETSQFQKKILNALSIYSKSSLEYEPEGKLIYIFSALETLLLKNENEPIQQNIGERMAFIIKKNKDDRKQVIHNTKQVYAMRSQFFHHGRSIEDTEAINLFMMNAWCTICSIVEYLNAFESKENFIQAIEDLKLS